MRIGVHRNKTNPAVTCGILANAVLEKLNNQSVVGADDIYFKNVMRVLEMYKSGILKSYTPVGVLQRSSLNPKPFDDRSSSMGRILDALDQARSTVYPDLAPRETADRLQALLRQSADERDQEELTLACRFFEQLQGNLKGR